MPRTHISELVLFQEAMLLRPHLRMRVVSDGLDRAPVNFPAYTDQSTWQQVAHVHFHLVCRLFLVHLEQSTPAEVCDAEPSRASLERAR